MLRNFGYTLTKKSLKDFNMKENKLKENALKSMFFSLLSYSPSLMALPYGHLSGESCLWQLFYRAERRLKESKDEI
ncbi:MAG: hypothetical protein KatS3mg001_429 [Candidatus Pacearchaeota archaeon]|nr:MAG: hypothetical protein KatS3mg001_429 [Candidatus Pacearchaeota archaeon]